MKTLKAYIYLFITLLVLNVKSNVIREYQFNRKIKRDDTPAVTSNVGGEVNSPTNNIIPPTTDATIPEPSKPAEPVDTTPSQEVTAPTPTTVPVQEPDKPTTPPSNQEIKTTKNDSNNEDIKTKTDDTPNKTTSSPHSTNDSNSNNNDDNNNNNNNTNNNNNHNNNNNNSSNDNDSKTSNNNSNSNESNDNKSQTTDNDNTSNTSNTSTSNNNTSNTINTIKTNTSTSNKKNDDGGLSGGVIALIVVGGIFALGVVILVFRSLLKLCTKSSKDYPDPVLNVDSSAQLNPQVKMSQDPMVESGYYNQSTATIPAAGTIVGINEDPQYYQSQQPQYDNVGVDISNQYQQDNYQNYQNGYVDDMRVNSINNGNMANDYPLSQQEVIQPVRNYSSLRRPTTSSGVPEIPLEGYDDPTMMTGEITDAGQIPHKVIINKVNNIPIEPGTIHKAQFPFSPNMDDELRLNSGDSVEIIEVYDDGWSYGKNVITNEVGVFPISYITGYNDPSNNF